MKTIAAARVRKEYIPRKKTVNIGPARRAPNLSRANTDISDCTAICSSNLMEAWPQISIDSEPELN